MYHSWVVWLICIIDKDALFFFLWYYIIYSKLIRETLKLWHLNPWTIALFYRLMTITSLTWLNFIWMCACVRVFMCAGVPPRCIAHNPRTWQSHSFFFPVFSPFHSSNLHSSFFLCLTPAPSFPVDSPWARTIIGLLIQQKIHRTPPLVTTCLRKEKKRKRKKRETYFVDYDG